MLFVDGENLTMRAQEVAKQENLLLEGDSQHYVKNVFVWCPGVPARTPYYLVNIPDTAIRAYYYTSIVADYPKVDEVRGQLRALGFDPQVFKKLAGKSKGVDIALTKDMLAHAFEDHYDMAMLFAGDRDYVPLIEEVKRRGKNVYVCFFAGEQEKSGLAPEVRLVADQFLNLTPAFLRTWQGARR
jgi:uncharacterized LabA/DUF88 family protein